MVESVSSFLITALMVVPAGTLISGAGIWGGFPSSLKAATSIDGPLRLSGEGTWTTATGLRFTAYAEADESERVRLQSLLGLLGRREGARTMIKIGA